MSIQRKSKVILLNRVLYRSLLIIYPCDLRQRFGADMADLFEIMMRDAIKAGPAEMISLLASLLWEFVTVAVPLRLASNAVMAGAISFLASSAVVLFFFRAVS